MTATALLAALVMLLVGVIVGLAVARRPSRYGEHSGSTDRAVAALRDSFGALSAEALRQNSQQLADLAGVHLKQALAEARGDFATRQQAVDGLVGPLRESLDRVESQLRSVERDRVAAFAAVSEQVALVRESSEQLRSETAALVTALRKPQVRGRWGEMQLRRAAELAGMLEHCDFDEQVTVRGPDGNQRLDMVVRLAGGKHVVVDAKVPLTAFLDAAESSEEHVREHRLDAHARQLRSHVDDLAAKSYWERLPASPEFVVLFVPGESFLAPALERMPDLQEYAASRRVLLVTPTTLIALLRTVDFAWRQERLADSAREVFEVGRELYSRLAVMGEHVDKLGRALNTAVGSYNRTVGSFEGRVLVTARKLVDLKVADKELPRPLQVDAVARSLPVSPLAVLDSQFPDVP